MPGSCRFAHLSDLHLTDLSAAPRAELRGKRFLGYLSWRRKRRHEHRRDILERVTAHLREDTPQQVLISGDLTHIGLEREFREAADWLRALGPARDIAVVPGNHELCAHEGTRQGLAHWADYLSGDANSEAPFPSVRERDGVAFIGVSTAIVTPALLASGRVGQAQRKRLGDCLADCAERGLFRVLYLHHSPLAGTDKWRKRLTDGAAVSAVLREQGVELILHGHCHRSLDGTLATRHGPATVLGAPSASAAGRYGGEPAGYRRFELRRDPDGWQLCVQRFSYEPLSEQVLAVGDRELRVFPRAHAALAT